MSARDTPDTKGKKSKYQKKVRAKFGKGKPDPKWMWWLERAEPQP